MEFDFSIVLTNIVYLLNGIYLTFEVTGLALIIGTILGMGICLAKLAKHWLLSFPAVAYIEFFQNTPVLVQLIWLYYLLPIILGFGMSALVSCTIALGLNVAAYLAETFRGGIQWVERGQIEAGYSLGLSHFQTLRKIILPQAIKVIIPPFINRVVGLLKTSSLVSILGIAELTYRATVIASTTYRCVELYTFLGGLYILILLGISSLANFLDKRFAASI